MGPGYSGAASLVRAGVLSKEDYLPHILIPDAQLYKRPDELQVVSQCFPTRTDAAEVLHHEPPVVAYMSQCFEDQAEVNHPVLEWRPPRLPHSTAGGPLEGRVLDVDVRQVRTKQLGTDAVVLEAFPGHVSGVEDHAYQVGVEVRNEPVGERGARADGPVVDLYERLDSVGPGEILDPVQKLPGRCVQVTDSDVGAKPRYLQARLLRDAARPAGLLLSGRQCAQVVPPERGL